MSGGNDGLNTIVPFGNDLYYKARPTIGISKDSTLKLNDQIGLHPSLAPLKREFDAGHMAIIQNTGYPIPTVPISARWKSGTPPPMPTVPASAEAGSDALRRPVRRLRSPRRPQ